MKIKQNEIDDLEINYISEIAEREREREKETFKLKLLKFIKIYNIRNLIFSAQSPAPVPEFKKILQLTKKYIGLVEL